MKKLLYTVVILFLGVAVGRLLMFDFKENIVNSENVMTRENINMLSMMLETDAGSGNYEMTTRDSWPTEGYIFNSELSKCENGGELSWDDTNKQVLMSSNISDKCYIYFDKYTPIIINDYSITANGNSITVTIDATSGTGSIVKYLYSKDNGVSYVESANNTYTFSWLTTGTYNIKAYVLDSNGKNSKVVSKNINMTSVTLANCVVEQYNGVQGNNDLYYHNGTITSDDGTVIDANDGSYRYAGANPNNFVCFGSNESPCPTDNLYRIIGVFDGKVKLIKYDYANSNLLGTNGDYTEYTYSKSSYSTYNGELTTINRYYWNQNSLNTWSTSLFNKTNLNTNFINNIGATWAEKIALTTWKVGGNTFENIGKSAMYIAYQNEIVNPVKDYTYDAQIGLMFVSDYGYSASPTYWTYSGYNSDSTKDYRAATSSNWIYMGLDEWTISRDEFVYSGGGVSSTPQKTDTVFYVKYTGQVEAGSARTYYYAIRPVFNLLSSTIYVSGSGSISDPIRLS